MGQVLSPVRELEHKGRGPPRFQDSANYNRTWELHEYNDVSAGLR